MTIATLIKRKHLIGAMVLVSLHSNRTLRENNRALSLQQHVFISNGEKHGGMLADTLLEGLRILHPDPQAAGRR